MSLFKILSIILIGLFCAVGLAALIKKQTPKKLNVSERPAPIEIKLNPQTEMIRPASNENKSVVIAAKKNSTDVVALSQETSSQKSAALEPSKVVPSAKLGEEVPLPEADRIEEFFNTSEPKLPIVETIIYKSRVPWQKGRPAWFCDYAAHYETSRHFIARSLNGKPDYLTQEIKEGDKFNVLKLDKNYRFHLVVDTSRCQLWFYVVDLEQKKNTLIKMYQVCLGRLDAAKSSGLLTPLGTYLLGKKTATYDSKTTGMYRGQKVVMKTIFGTRWIPFEKEIGACTAPAKGFGIHGTPWETGKDEKITNEKTESLGCYESDGCIRLATEDIEELFAIITTKPTQIEIVRHFSESTMAQEK